MSIGSVTGSAEAPYAQQSVKETASIKGSEKDVTQATEKKAVTGNTIGSPKLSEKALKYYEELKKKYSNMNFILVSEDQKAYAQANIGNYANGNKMAVLIDEDKIERMANDEEYRAQYEAIIENAASGISSLKQSLESSGAKVSAYGIQVNDGGQASYFAVIDESLKAQKERIEEKAEEKRAKRKEEQAEAAEERIENRRANAAEKAEDADKTQKSTGQTVITASSVEELLKKIQDYTYGKMSDSVQTDAEKQVGQTIDFKL